MPRRFAPRAGASSRAITSTGGWGRMPTAALFRPGANGSPHAPQSGRLHSSILCPENPGRYNLGIGADGSPPKGLTAIGCRLCRKELARSVSLLHPLLKSRERIDAGV